MKSPGWNYGPMQEKALTLFIRKTEGKGKRRAFAYDFNGGYKAPQLLLEYSTVKSSSNSVADKLVDIKGTVLQVGNDRVMKIYNVFDLKSEPSLFHVSASNGGKKRLCKSAHLQVLSGGAHDGNFAKVIIWHFMAT